MKELTVEWLLVIISSIVVLSYLFSVISRHIRIPSVLLLLFTGVGFRMLADSAGQKVSFPPAIIEILGVVGLIMIILEAGLDLKLRRDKLSLIRDTFFSALIIFMITAPMIAYILHYFLAEPMVICLIYSIPLSIMSSSIVIPSIHNLTERKKEFLIYEASFSDILGILFFNFLTAESDITLNTVGLFAGSLFISIVLSALFSILLFLILVKSTIKIRFFLVFALLVGIYVSGKLLHLPSLLAILIFGLFINNLEAIPFAWFRNMFPVKVVSELRHLMHTLTAESSFLIRTFFFILFGFSITTGFFGNQDVVVTGGLIVFVLLLVRFLYLRFFLKTNVFPETFFIPRGLITIVLFYKIPEQFKLESFNEDILFFIILVTGLIMTLGMIFYRKPSSEIVEEATFSDRKDIL